SERRVRGAVERTYALRLEGSLLGPAEMAGFSRDDHAHAFGTFVAALLSAYERYLAQPAADPVHDGATYSMNALWLSDNEYAEFLRDVATLVQPRLAYGPEPGRRRRLIASAFLPLAAAPGGDGGTDG
ncbi:MAG: ArsR family transcriptional regulator, partial [Betaproteobacteria bacterium]